MLFLLILVAIIESIISVYLVYLFTEDRKTFKDFLIFLFLNKNSFYVEYNIVMVFFIFIVYLITNAAIYNSFIK